MFYASLQNIIKEEYLNLIDIMTTKIEGLNKRIKELERKAERVKEIEKKLIISEERFRTLFEGADDAIFTLDLIGRFTSGNKKAEEICGYEREELMGKSFVTILEKKDIPRILGIFKDIVAKKEGAYQFKSKIIRQDGTLVPIEVKGSIIREGGRIVGVLGIARDITKHERMIAELEKKNKELEQFNKLAVGREMKMIELKNKLKELEHQLTKKNI